MLALCFAISRLGFAYKLASLGYGRHVWDVPPQNYNGFNIFLGSDSILYVMGVSFAKLAVLILLLRIFSVDKRFRHVCFTIAPLILFWGIITIFVQIFRCRPFKASWDANYSITHHDYKCLDRIKLVIVFGWFNIITDFVLLLLPMPMLVRMHLTWQKKLGLAFVFATGGLVCAMSIIRQIILYRNAMSGKAETDGTWTEVPNYTWFQLELNIGILSGCLPILHPLLRRIPPLKQYMPLSLRSLFSTHSLISRSSRPSRSKKSTTPAQADIELANPSKEGSQGGSQGSGNETLVGDRGEAWSNGDILRTDEYNVSSEDLAGDLEKARRHARARSGGIYSGG
ncbi:MAG: hypothetical protein LQ350_008525 [Teloschistes chrysophthalmus]|nr:MAG: hypothetical protein LQ350_008525 [Niorma chrysophthalma]